MHSCKNMIDGGEGSDGLKLVSPPREASLLVLRVKKDRGRLQAAGIAVVVGARHSSVSSSSRSRGPRFFLVVLGFLG